MAKKSIARTLAAAVTALALGISSSAFAQHRGDDHRDDHHDAHHDEHRGPDRHAPERGGPPPRFVDQRGAGPDHNFHRGGRLSAQYRSHQYVVDDWRGHHLSAPPRGYHWVQTGGDYVLAAIATGIIADILLNH